MSKAVFLYLLCALYSAHQSAGAQESFPPKNSLVSDRYYEGFRSYKNVSAGRLDLISCVASRQSADASNGMFSIQFYVPPGVEGKLIEIFVEDRATHTYFMIPVQKQWSAGNHIFSWNSRTAEEHGVHLSNLCGVAKLQSPGADQTILPLNFFGSNAPISLRQVEYEFIFIATREATLRYSILDANETEIGSGKLLDQPRNRAAIFRWTPESSIRAGQYLLLVEYQLRNGQVIQGQSIYYFHHGK